MSIKWVWATNALNHPCSAIARMILEDYFGQNSPSAASVLPLQTKDPTSQRSAVKRVELCRRRQAAADAVGHVRCRLALIVKAGHYKCRSVDDATDDVRVSHGDQG